jgi:hypothetical protein
MEEFYDFPDEDVDKIGTCQCCDKEDAKLSFSPRCDEYYCYNCWEGIADLIWGGY